MIRISCRLALSFLFYLITSDLVVRGLPDGFVQDLVAYVPPNLLPNTVITAVTIAPNPQSLSNSSTLSRAALIFLASKDGKIIVIETNNAKSTWLPSSNVTTISDWKPRVCHDGTRWGIHSMVVHPKFASTHPYLYIMYSSRNSDGVCWDKTLRSAAVNRVSRATVHFCPWKLTSELTLLELTSTQQAFVSAETPQEGTLSFGNDGILYIATTSYDANSTIDRTPFLQGTLLRIKDDGSIPQDNPYVSSLRAVTPCGKRIPSKSLKTCAEIFATGLHRPVAMAMDPDTKGDNVQFYVLDRGASMWEEIHKGGTDMPLANYGWPSREGPCERGSITKCYTGTKRQVMYVEPIYFYQHENGVENSVAPPTGEVSTAAFVSQKAGWPSLYRFLFYDKVAGNIYNLVSNSSHACPSCVPPIPGFHNETFSSFQNVADMSFLRRKDLFVTACTNSKGCQIWQIRYTGMTTEKQSSPAMILVNNATGERREIIAFDTGDNTETGTYIWQFGDGSSSTEKNPIHIYKDDGKYFINLFKKDQNGLVTQDITSIQVGMSPFQGIVTPDWGGRFEVGKSYNLVGYAEDVDESHMLWEVQISRIGMNYSRTLLERTAGNRLSVFPVPGPEDYKAAKNSYLEIIMTSMNKAGLTSKESLVIYPTLSDVVITSKPPGLEVLVDDVLIVTPKLITTWKNHTLRLEALDQPPFYFQSWSDGGQRSRTFFVPTAAFPNRPKPTINVTFIDRSLPLKPKTRDCSKSKKCGLCEGHCQHDSECQC